MIKAVFGAVAVSIGLSGCASGFDPEAMPAAQQANQLGYERCNAVTPRTYAGMVECYLASDKALAVQIKLKNMGLYDVFAARMRLIAGDVSAGRISDATYIERVKGAQTDYIAAIYQDFQQRAQDNAEVTGFLGSFARGVVEGAAEAQANRPRSTYCSGTVDGNSVSAVCH